jgi:solute carrier family 25 phosphate transporter 3
MGDVHDASYYGKCVIGGALACGGTHALITPLDLVKCRRQVNPDMYPSLVAGIRSINGKSGMGTTGLYTGGVPTLIGYSLQGMCKFGFYEMFKDVYAKAAGDNADKFKVFGWAISSACAEVIADVALCPWEAIKVRMQTSPEGTFPTGLGEAWNKITAAEGTNGLYKGLSPLWARQIPYTVVKFVFFEQVVAMFYRHIFTAPKESYGKATQLSITFASGYTAGVLCAIVSHPADTMVSKLNAVKSEGSTSENVKKIYAEIGFNGLWRGLGTRIIMIGTLTGLQWWIYDSFKTAVGLQTSGGSMKKK